MITSEIETIDKNTLKFRDLNLLIVEDDELNLELLGIILKNTFQKICIAMSGREAIQFCKNSSEVDLVIIDINSSKMNGFGAIREIRKFNKDLVIIAQTTYALLGDKEKTIEAGCNDYISKPINKKLLLEIISKHIGKKGTVASAKNKY